MAHAVQLSRAGQQTLNTARASSCFDWIDPSLGERERDEEGNAFMTLGLIVLRRGSSACMDWTGLDGGRYGATMTLLACLPEGERRWIHQAG